MRESERRELERRRESGRKKAAYINKYSKDNYARLVCLLPRGKRAAFDAARGDMAVSAYINALIDADLTRRGLIDGEKRAED